MQEGVNAGRRLAQQHRLLQNLRFKWAGSRFHVPIIQVCNIISTVAIRRRCWDDKAVHNFEIFKWVLGHRHVWVVVEVFAEHGTLSVIFFGDEEYRQVVEGSIVSHSSSERAHGERYHLLCSRR